MSRSYNKEKPALLVPKKESFGLGELLYSNKFDKIRNTAIDVFYLILLYLFLFLIIAEILYPEEIFIGLLIILDYILYLYICRQEDHQYSQ